MGRPPSFCILEGGLPDAAFRRHGLGFAFFRKLVQHFRKGRVTDANGQTTTVCRPFV